MQASGPPGPIGSSDAGSWALWEFEFRGPLVDDLDLLLFRAARKRAVAVFPLVSRPVKDDNPEPARSFRRIWGQVEGHLHFGIDRLDDGSSSQQTPIRGREIKLGIRAALEWGQFEVHFYSPPVRIWTYGQVPDADFVWWEGCVLRVCEKNIHGSASLCLLIARNWEFGG